MDQLELTRWKSYYWMLDSLCSHLVARTTAVDLNIEEWAFIVAWEYSDYFLPLKGSVSVIAPPRTSEQTLAGSTRPVDQSWTCTERLLVHQLAVTTQWHIHLKVELYRVSVLNCSVFMRCCASRSKGHFLSFLLKLWVCLCRSVRSCTVRLLVCVCVCVSILCFLKKLLHIKWNIRLISELGERITGAICENWPSVNFIVQTDRRWYITGVTANCCQLWLLLAS